MKYTPTQYSLYSVQDGITFFDEGWSMDPPAGSPPGLVRAFYETVQLGTGFQGPGLFRFADWLPVRWIPEGSSAPVTFRCHRLGAALGLKELWITFSGYWPEKGASMETCSFKETEAYSVCGRLPADNRKVLVVASAGNTARSFARVCSDNDIPLLLFVPEDNLDALWSGRPFGDCVQLICTPPGSDYFDAIALSGEAALLEGFIAEGGARNIARRDGMGTTVLSAVTTIGHIPSFYFQAVGSGTGAIAAWEANMRLIRDGRFGNRKMQLVVSQNLPFAPMADAWDKGSRVLYFEDESRARSDANAIWARVLSNRKPPYGIAGGLFDALTDTGGIICRIRNEEGQKAAALFEELEGNDIHPAAAIALASLIQRVQQGLLPANETIMLNITGGGEKRYKNDRNLYYLKPSAILSGSSGRKELEPVVRDLFRGRV